MRCLLLVFILCIIYSLTQITESETPIKKEIYPKKFRTGLVLYNNDGKYVKSSVVPVPELKRESANAKGYTVFAKPYPHMNGAGHQSFPDSPYFPLDHQDPHERRSRVKKVLPDFKVQRQKRSVGNQNGNEKPKPADQPKTKSEVVTKKSTAVKNKNGSPKRLRVSKAGKNQSQVRTHKGKGLGKRHVLSNSTAQRGQKLNNKRLKKKRSTGGRLRNQPKNNQKLLNSAPGPKKVVRGKKVKQLKGQGVIPQKKISQSQRNRTINNALRSGRKVDARRLIAARDALIEDYPYTISIQKGHEHWCAGAILNPRLIITTANCLWKANTISRLRVRAGSRHTNHGGQVAKIKEVMKHPNWKLRRNPDNDVALAVLDRNIRFSHDLHGVDLPNRVMLPAFDDVWVTSWGSDRRDGVFERRNMALQVYHARLMERDKCNNITQRFGVLVTENFICLAQTGKRAPCTRDTGAPAVSDGVLWGIASWGIRKLCGTERYPAVFSYLASQSNMDFIVNASHLLMADERFNPFPDRYPLRKYPLTTTTHSPLSW